MNIGKKVASVGVFAITAVMVVGVPVSYAALSADSSLTQSVTAGTLSTSVRDAAGSVVASPSFGMSNTTASSTSAQTSTGTFGSATQRITVDNPGASNGGWTLALSATGAWSNVGATESYPFDAATSADGQLTVDPSTATLTAVTGGATGVSQGSSATFVNGVTDSIQLLNAGATSADVWNGYLTGVGLSQTVPAGTPVDSYSLTVTQTVATQ